MRAHARAMDAKGLSEGEHYASFVDRTLAHVIAGLQTDGAAKKRKIANGLSNAPSTAPPHARVAFGARSKALLLAALPRAGSSALWRQRSRLVSRLQD